MKSKIFIVFLLVLVLFLPMFSPTPVHAFQVDQPQTDYVADFLGALQTAWDALKGMVYVAVIGSTIVNLLKSKGIVRNDQAQIALTVMGAVAILIFGVIKYFFPDYNLLVFDEYAALIVNTDGTFTPVALLIGNLLSKLFHTVVLRGIPAIGYSFSYNWNKMPSAKIRPLNE